MPKPRNVTVAAAFPIAASLALARATHASPSCALDRDPELDQICERNRVDLPTIRKLVCLVFEPC